MDQAKESQSVCIQNNQFIYVIGGYKYPNICNDIEKYEIADNSWVTIKIKSYLMKRLDAFSIQINPSRILIAGGYDASSLKNLKDCYIVDTTTGSLNKACDLPEADDFPSPSVLISDKNLYAISRGKSIIKYSIENNKWEKVCNNIVTA